jgi:hypothetical protein
MNPSRHGIASRAVLAGLCFVVVDSHAAKPAAEEAARDANACELIIGGKFIKKLILVNGEGRQLRLDSPGQKVWLPAGRYRVSEIRLCGGYTSYVYREGAREWFSLIPERPYRLEVGAPLSPDVGVRRWGRDLVLDYELVGLGGHRYFGPTSPSQSRFVVRKDGRQIGSGSFKYG